MTHRKVDTADFLTCGDKEYCYLLVGWQPLQVIPQTPSPPPLLPSSQHLVRLFRQFLGTHLYSWLGRGNVRVTRLVQEHIMNHRGNPTRPLKSESRPEFSADRKALVSPIHFLEPFRIFCRFSTSTFRLTSLTNSVTQFSTEADLEQVWHIFIWILGLNSLIHQLCFSNLSLKWEILQAPGLKICWLTFWSVQLWYFSRWI